GGGWADLALDRRRAQLGGGLRQRPRLGLLRVGLGGRGGDFRRRAGGVFVLRGQRQDLGLHVAAENPPRPRGGVPPPLPGGWSPVRRRRQGRHLTQRRSRQDLGEAGERHL